MKKHSVRLLTKTTFFYLLFILIAFFVTAIFIIIRTDSYIQNDTEHFFMRKEFRINHEIRTGEEAICDIRGIKLLNKSQVIDTLSYPQYADTSIYISQMDEWLLFRTKKVIINHNNKFYEYKMLKNVSDYEKLRQDLIRTILNTLITLTIGLTLFSLFLSGFFFRPFHKVLSLMASYKVGQSQSFPSVKTSTSEFRKMQALFAKMIRRTETDFTKLKEYTENMAHEMQTPLAIIRSKVEALIANESVMESASSTVKSIYDEVNQLSNLGNTLNLFTKIENGEYSNIIELKTYDVINRHLEAVKEMVELKGFTVKAELNPEHSLTIDPFLFDILFKNLLRNALRYGECSSPIRIKTELNKLSISNAGEALKVDSSKIFERFVSSNQSASSLGLGLSLVKRICDLSGLEISYSFDSNTHIFSITSNPV